MIGSIYRRNRRGVIGMIAAYALVLQAFLATSVMAQAAAQGDAATSGAFFIICVSHDGVASPDGTNPSTAPAAHCPVCTLSGSAAAVLPEPAMLDALPAVWTEPTPFVSVDACIAFHARAGLSRAPPRNA